MAKYWQIAAGDQDQGRHYGKEFLKYGMAFIADKTGSSGF